MSFSMVVAVLTLFGADGPVMSNADYLNALNAYRAVARGEISVNQLTPQQRADILEIDRRLREGELPRGTPQERCIDEQVRQHRGDPSQLDWEVIDLACSQH
ncbi:MAG: hypothetical protein RLN87_08905 [Parasphingopyxis sp.]|uniref:hypothetical protein n=1 Tax=Parasphingopyxis sp. TaxID=1920299 RepID=UPI0032EB07ED